MNLRMDMAEDQVRHLKTTKINQPELKAKRQKDEAGKN